MRGKMYMQEGGVYGSQCRRCLLREAVLMPRSVSLDSLFSPSDRNHYLIRHIETR